MKPIVALVPLLFCACSFTVLDPETREETETDRQRLRSGVAEILGVPEKSVSDLEYLRQHFLGKIKVNTPQHEVREILKTIFATHPQELVVELEYTQRRDSVIITYRGKQHVFREVFDFYYDNNRRFVKFFGAMMSERKAATHSEEDAKRAKK
jgi:hypothetical protein